MFETISKTTDYVALVLGDLYNFVFEANFLTGLLDLLDNYLLISATAPALYEWLSDILSNSAVSFLNVPTLQFIASFGLVFALITSAVLALISVIK